MAVPAGPECARLGQVPMKVRLLGPTEVVGDDGRLVELPRGLARSLLALLALHPGAVLSADRLIDALWGAQPPATATTALHGYVSALRKRFEPNRARGEAARNLVTHPPGYVLAIDADRVDAERFRRLVREAMGAPLHEKARRLRAALGLWRGPALADFAYEPFAQNQIAALDQLRLTALEARIDADLQLGRHADVVAELETLVAEHPLHEGFQGHLMLALYRCGRQTDALQVYRDVRGRLIDEHGIEPGPRLQRLERAILDQDQSLAVPTAVQVPGTAEVHDASGAWLDDGGRRTVTAVFIDCSVVASTPGGRADPEVMRSIVAQGHRAVRAVVERHDGSIQGAVGDVLTMVFGLPVAHEDDAARAVRAAVTIRGELARVNGQAKTDHGLALAGRMGIDTGEVVVTRSAVDGTGVTGSPVAHAARLQQAAGDGEVLLGDATRRLAQGIAFTEPAAGTGAWRLVDVVEEPARLVAPDGTLVGRDDELAELADALDTTVGSDQASMVTIVGEAGVGKSRLAQAFTSAIEDARVVVGRCRAYGDGITFWPLREIVADLAGATGDGLAEMLAGHSDASSNAAQIAAAAGLSDEAVERPAELFPAFRQLFEVASHDAPLVAVVEDAHWAEPTLLDLVEYLAASVRGPVLWLCLARPDLLTRRSEWGSQLTASRISLERLSTPDARRLVIDRLGGRPLASETMGHILAMGQGNPLFLEQLLAAAHDDSELRLPPTVDAVLTARLDRLGPAEKDALRVASVVGTDVPRDALAALMPAEARAHLARHLTALTAKALIRPWHHGASAAGGFDFNHVLIQQAAYRSLTHSARAELHARLAAWLESDRDAQPTEAEELVGHHLEQAFRHARELGRSDVETARLAVRAGERLASAGLRAYARFDVPAAQNLLARARDLLPADHDARPRVLRRLAEAYPVMGHRAEAEGVFAELLALADAAGSHLTVRSVRLEHARFQLITGPDPVPLATIQAEAEEALGAFQEAGDDVGVSQAHYVLASVRLRAGRIAELEEIGRRAIENARRTGDLRERLGARWWVIFAMLAGPTPVPACIRTIEEITDVGGLTHLGALAALGHFKAMLGQFEEGRRLATRARELVRERIRIPRPLAFVGERSAGIEQLAGRPHAAVRALREALDMARRVSDREQTSHLAAQLSLRLADLGDRDEAHHAAEIASRAAPAESVTSQALARAATSRTALGAHHVKKAETSIHEAITMVPADMLDLRALLHANLAKVVASAGREHDARDLIDEAVGLYQRKGNVVAAQRTTTLLASGTPPATQRTPRTESPWVS